MDPIAFDPWMAAGIVAAIFGVVSVIYHAAVDRQTFSEIDETMRWLEDPDTQRRIREMEQSGRTIEYSDNVKHYIRKSRGE